MEKPTYSDEDIIRKIALESDLTQRDAKKFLDAFKQVVYDTVPKGYKIKVTDVAQIYRKKRKSKKGYHIGKGEVVEYPEKYIVEANFSRNLQEAVKEDYNLPNKYQDD